MRITVLLAVAGIALGAFEACNPSTGKPPEATGAKTCLLYTSDAADE